MLARIGFGEILVILIVAMFVVGPERLPKLARGAGKAIANFRKYMNNMTEDLKEAGLDFKEVREVSQEIQNVRRDLSSMLTDVGKDVEHSMDSVGQTLNEVSTDAQNAVLPTAKPPMPKGAWTREEALQAATESTIVTPPSTADSPENTPSA